ncbi:MAG: hypothetical protein IE914_06120 [Thiotrichales bacterium]|nr:hypothetical protein [Thiotrichales bacterium]
MMTYRFKLEVSFFDKGEIQKKQKDVTCSSVSIAWREALKMLPMGAANQAQIRVLPLK